MIFHQLTQGKREDTFEQREIRRNYCVGSFFNTPQALSLIEVWTREGLGIAVWVANEKHDAVAFSTHKQAVLEIIQNKKVTYKRPPTAPDLHQ